MDEAIENLLDELEAILDNSRAMPFSNKVTVDKDDIYEIIGEIRMKMPNELKQARWVLEERTKILADAQNEADDLVRTTEEQIKKMVDANEITKMAYEQADIIVQSSKEAAREMRIGAMEYADQVLSTAEMRIREMFERIQQENALTESFFNETLNVIYENRQELREVNK